ncbi:MAG: glycoside hydrolase family 15 protein [Conexivisphaera sp.]
MPRQLFLGNGAIAALYDGSFSLTDLYYPLLDQHHNHSVGGRFRVGIWHDGKFAWLEGVEHRVFQEGMRAGVEGSFDGLKFRIVDTVSMRHPALVRSVKANGPGYVRFIFYNDFRLNNTELGDTAFYDPSLDAVMHYKGSTWFAIASSGQLYEYATGRRDQGAVLRDCEDGTLGKNPIAQGSVDSAVSVAANEFYLYVVAGGDRSSVAASLEDLRRDSGERFEADAKYWDVVVPIDDPLERQSVMVLLGHFGRAGEVPASLDTGILKFNLDTYAYLWPRDAVMCATVLDEMGYWSFTRRLYVRLFTELLSPEGYLYQKYDADGTLGSTWHPFTANGPRSRNVQEDETALAIYGLWVHFRASRDYELLREVYECVERSARFLIDFRDGRTGLPLMSYDLWEERLGVHAFTVASVVAGLRAAAELAGRLGYWDMERKYSEAAKEMTAAVVDHMFNSTGGYFYRMVDLDGGSDPTVDSSVLSLPLLGVVDPSDPRVSSTAQVVASRLQVPKVGGIARYENDLYQRVSGDYSGIPGNPWIISTMWLAQYHVLAGKPDEARRLVEWVGKVASPTGLLPEQVNPFDGSPLSVMPLAWSHAEYLRALGAVRSGARARAAAPRDA